MTSNYFQQYIVGYTVANFWRYPIRRHIIKSSALEYIFSISFLAKCDFCLLITFTSSLNPDQDWQNVGPDLDSNGLTLW